MRYLYLFLFFALQFSIASAQLEPSTQVRFIRQDCGLQVFSDGKTQMILDLTSIQWSVTTKANQTHVTIFDGVSEISVRTSDIAGYSPKSQSAKLLVEDLTEWKALCNSIFYLDSMISVLNAILEDSTVCVTCPVELGDETMTSFESWFIATWKLIQSEFGNQNNILDDLFAAQNVLLNNLIDCCNKLNDQIGDLITVVSKEFDNQNTLLDGWFTNLTNAVTDCCKAIIEKLEKEFANQNTLLGDWFNTTWDVIQKEFANQNTLLGDYFSALIDCCKQLSELIQEQTSLLNEWFNITWELLDKLFNETWNVISKEFANQNTLLAGWFSDLGATIQACCKDIITKLEKEFAIQNELLQIEFDQTQLELDSIQIVINEEFVKQNNLLDKLFNETWNVISKEFDSQNTLLDGWFTDLRNEISACCKDIITILQAEFKAQNLLLQTEFDESQLELDTIAAAISDQTDTVVLTIENLYSLIDGISFDTTQVDTNDLTPVITELKDLYTLISGINFDTTHVDTNDLSPLLAELDSIAMAISDQSDTLITTMTALLTDSLLSSGCAYTADFDKLSGPGTITYPANSLHSLDFVVVAGSVSVTIGAKTLVFGVGETASFNSGECKNLLNNFVFTTTGVSDVVNIQLLK